MAHVGLATTLLVLYGLYLLLALPLAALQSSTTTLADARAALLRRPLPDSPAFPPPLRFHPLATSKICCNSLVFGAIAALAPTKFHKQMMHKVPWY